ncbi:MAG: TrkH family potassium uptake protein [Sedimentisphaerales bacterium]|nr:TrkH family potassium uptake protein [Sedimentisphaerales bacterium]
MILKPQLQDFRNIGYYTGRIIIGISLAMLVPMVVGLLLEEINPALDFLIGAEIALLAGLILTRLCHTERDLNWMQGMVVVSLSWLAAMLVAAIPLYLSGHWASYFNACFESMSGFTATGLTLVQDLDHLSHAHNLWRHLIQFIGGQGIVVVAVSSFIKGLSGAFKMYVGEGRDERLLPNIIHTSRFIWLVSIIYLILGTSVLGIVGISNGMRPFSAFFHGVCIFMAAFDTAGFAPQSQSILYYHSPLFEIITIVIMLIGAMNFNLHYCIWTGNRREMWKNIETRTLCISIAIIFLIVLIGLNQVGSYSGTLVMFRKGFYQMISAHTTTGYVTIYARQFIDEWGNLAFVGIILAMALGSGACSTSGGIKMLRLGIIAEALKQDIKRIILPERAVIEQKLHHLKEIFLEDKQVRSALIITMAYLLLYGIGTFIGMFYGYSFLESLFESTSASANVGLSCGITMPAMPAGLKLTYIVQMWAGRLEFMSVFTLIGFLVSAIKGK